VSKLLGLGALGTLWCLNLAIGFVIGPKRVIELSVVVGRFRPEEVIGKIA